MEPLAKDDLTAALARFRAQMQAFREAQQLTMAQATLRAGLSTGEWSRIESGQVRSPGLEKVLRIQYALQMDSVESLFGQFPSRRLLDGDAGL